MFATTQTEFASALLDATQPVPEALTSHTARAPDKRFAVYRNNVIAGLMNALRSRFPATSKIVGDEFFAVLARIFVSVHPPRSKILSVYGDGFPDFIAAFEPAAELPYLADVARIEAARTRAYHAADANPLSPDGLAALDPARLNIARALLHPSLQIVRSRHPAVTIWAMNSGEAELGAIDETQPEDALVLRPAFDVAVRALPPGGAAFLLALAAGETLAQAANAAFGETSAFDLTANIAGLIQSGALIDFIITDEVQP